jgi:hypothetical protein
VGQTYSAFCVVGFLIPNAPERRKAGRRKLKPRARGVIIFFFLFFELLSGNISSQRFNSLYANGRVLILFGVTSSVVITESKISKSENSTNGISPNKINTLLAYGLSSQSCLNFILLSARAVF